MRGTVRLRESVVLDTSLLSGADQYCHKLVSCSQYSVCCRVKLGVIKPAAL